MKRHTIRHLCAAAAAAIAIVACRHNRFGPESEDGREHLTVEQAQEFFETEGTALYLRSLEQSDDRNGKRYALDPGDFTPVWKQNRRAWNINTDAVDVMIAPTYQYAAVFGAVGTDGDTLRKVVPVEQKLVVTQWYKHPRWEGRYAYIASIIPTPDYYAKNKNFRFDFASLSEKGNFTGLVYYHSLDGRFINADRMVNGKLISRVYPEGGITAENYAQTVHQLEIITEGIGMMMADGYELPGPDDFEREANAVVCTACKNCGRMLCACWTPILPKPTRPPITIVVDYPYGGIGYEGGGGAGSGNIGTGNYNTVIPTQNNSDCDNNEKGKSGTSTMNFNTFRGKDRAFYQSNFLNPARASSNEHGMMGYRTFVPGSGMQADNYQTVTPGDENGINMKVRFEMETNSGTYAHIHSHTEKHLGGPSAVDLVNLGVGNKKSRHLEEGYIAAFREGGTVDYYVMRIENINAARAFADKYNGLYDVNNNFAKGTEARTFYDEMSSILSGHSVDGKSLSADEVHAYAMTYALNKLGAGISIMKMGDGESSFKRYDMNITTTTSPVNGQHQTTNIQLRKC